MPLFIFGIALKLRHNGAIFSILSEYLIIAGVFIISTCGYILMQLFVISGSNSKQLMKYINNLLPAIITGFGSMSSAAALPLLIKAAENNLKSKSNAAIIVPCSVNVHLVGDCFFIPFIALGISFSFGHGLPDIFTYLIFAVAAVPAGGIIVMLPILEKYLRFSTDMLALITTMYISFDCIVTACNVAGNGAFALIFGKITDLYKSKEREPSFENCNN
jgi:Na+/H+-dicarboxylate symporter